MVDRLVTQLRRPGLETSAVGYRECNVVESPGSRDARGDRTLVTQHDHGPALAVPEGDVSPIAVGGEPFEPQYE